MRKGLLVLIVILGVLLSAWLLNKYGYMYIDQEKANLALFYGTLAVATVGVLANFKGAMDLFNFRKPATKDNSKFRHNLPQEPYHEFIGREDDLKKIRQILSPQSRHFIISVDGVGGVGKTSLAIKVAYDYKEGFDKLNKLERFDAVVWMTAKKKYLTTEGINQTNNPLINLEGVLRTIPFVIDENPPAFPSITIDYVKRLLTQQRVLLIIDNFETIDDEGMLSFLRDIPTPTKVLITTRHRIDVSYPLRLLAMKEADALSLVDKELLDSEITLSPQEKQKLVGRTGGIPIAIIWVISLLKGGYMLQTVFEKLGEPSNDVVKYIFDLSVAEIKNTGAYKILLVLAFADGELTRDLVGMLSKMGVQDRDESLVKLEQLSLVVKNEDRFSMHPLTISYCQPLISANKLIVGEISKVFLDKNISNRIRYSDPDRNIFLPPQVNERETYFPGNLTTIAWSEISKRNNPTMYLRHSLIAPEQVLEYNSHIIISGPAGSGKSSMLRFISTTIIDKEIIPLIIPLRNFGINEGEERSIKSLLYEFNFYEQKVLLKLMEHGKVILLLDGLDEVRMSEFRNVTEIIKEISEIYIQTKIVITTRPFLDTSILTTFVEFEIAPLLPQDIDGIVRKYAKSGNIAEDILENFQDNTFLGSLITNRLYLNLILNLYSENPYLPSNRFELVDMAMRLIISDLDRSKHVLLSVPFELVRKVFAEVAFTMTKLEHDEFTEEDLTKALRNLEVTEDQTAEFYMLFLSLRTGLVISEGQGEYSFSHTMFLEYLTGFYLSTKMDFIFVEQRMFNPSWTDAIIYFAVFSKKVSALQEMYYNELLRIVETDELIRAKMKNMIKEPAHTEGWIRNPNLVGIELSSNQNSTFITAVKMLDGLLQLEDFPKIFRVSDSLNQVLFGTK